MTDRRNVTVYNRVAVTALMSPDQVATYLERNEWAVVYEWPHMRRFNRSGWIVDVCWDGWGLSHAITQIAGVESRQPGDVLLDIAKGPLPKPKLVEPGQLWAVDGGDPIEIPGIMVYGGIGFASDYDMLTSDRWTYHGRREEKTQ